MDAFFGPDSNMEVDIDLANSFLEHYPFVKDAHGNTPLHYAVQSESLALCYALVNTDLKDMIFERNAYGESPLTVALHHQNYEIMAILRYQPVHFGAKIQFAVMASDFAFLRDLGVYQEMVQDRQFQKLFLASLIKQNDLAKMEQFFLDSKANFNLSFSLHSAVNTYGPALCHSKSKEMTSFLLNYGATVTPDILLNAITQHDFEQYSLLISHYQPENSIMNKSVFESALNAENDSFLLLLLADRFTYTSAHLISACAVSHCIAVVYLLERGIDPNGQDQRLVSVNRYMSFTCSPLIVTTALCLLELLILFGADVNKAIICPQPFSKDVSQILEVALLQGQYEKCVFLIQKGAMVSAQSTTGYKDFTDSLLSGSFYDQELLDFAVFARCYDIDQFDILHALSELEFSHNHLYLISIFRHFEHSRDDLVRNFERSSGMSILRKIIHLYRSCEVLYSPYSDIGELGSLQFWIDHGADPNLPFQSSLLEDCSKTVKFLIEAGAHPNTFNSCQRTTLSALALNLRMPNRFELIKYFCALPEFEPRLYVEDFQRRTVLDYLSMHSQQDSTHDQSSHAILEFLLNDLPMQRKIGALAWMVIEARNSLTPKLQDMLRWRIFDEQVNIYF